MLQWPGEIIFACFLGIVMIVATILIQQPDPPQYPATPRQQAREPTPPSSPILNTLSTPYNEAEIVSLITELYKLLVKVAYLDNSQVTWPPVDSGHMINVDLCKQLGLDATVISLMKKIPYVDSCEEEEDDVIERPNLHGFHLFPRSMAYSFLRDDDIIESRDPENLAPRPGEKSKLRVDYILPHDIALSHNLRDGMTLVLDTKDNTIRMLDSADGPEYVNPKGTVLEHPEQPMYYRNYYTQHAPSYLRRLNEKISSLKLIPSGLSNFEMEYHGDEDFEVLISRVFEQRDEVKRILTKKYGWFDNFKQEEWARDAEGVWNDVIKKSIP